MDTGAYATMGKTAAPRDPDFQVALKRLHSVNARLNELSGIAGQSADRIVGPAPELVAGTVAKESVPVRGCIDELARAIDEASYTVERIYKNVTRITNEF